MVSCVATQAISGIFSFGFGHHRKLIERHV
jgi:hypothetical protein